MSIMDMLKEFKTNQSDDSLDEFMEEQELFHFVVKLPQDYVETARTTIESVYGAEIQNIKVHTPRPDGAVKYAFVAFVSYEEALRALSIDHCWPNGDPIDIRAEPEMPPEACQATHFDVLNTDCLHHVYRYLTPVDIAAASEALQCLSKFAIQNIYHKYATMTMFKCNEDDEVVCKDDKKSIQYTYEEFKSVFKHFGPFVTHCSISSETLTNPTMNHVRVILQYCPNLVQIRFVCFEFGPNALEILCNERLQATEVHFIRCDGYGDDWSPLWPQWSSLRSFTMVGKHIGNYPDDFLQAVIDVEMRDNDNPYLDDLVNLIDDPFLNGLTNLEELSFDSCTSSADDHTLSDVVSRSRTTLTTLSLLATKHNLYDQLFEIAPNLCQLVTDVNSPAQISPLHKLKNLKYLKLSIDRSTTYTSWTSQFESLKTLKALELDMSFARSMEIAAKMPTLRVLRVTFPLVGFLQIFDIVANLPNLKQLHLKHCLSKWDDVDTIRILERNASIEEIVLEQCNYACTGVPLLVDALERQATAMASPRARVRVTVRDEFNCRVPDDIDHTLVKIEFKPIISRAREMMKMIAGCRMKPPNDAYFGCPKPSYTAYLEGNSGDGNYAELYNRVMDVVQPGNRMIFDYDDDDE